MNWGSLIYKNYIHVKYFLYFYECTNLILYLFLLTFKGNIWVSDYDHYIYSSLFLYLLKKQICQKMILLRYSPKLKGYLLSVASFQDLSVYWLSTISKHL